MSTSTRPYQLASLGGTFESMHRGHREYIQLGLMVAEHIIVTLTTEDYAQRWKQYEVSGVDLRELRLRKFLRTRHVSESRFTIQRARGSEAIENTLLTPGLDLIVCIERYLDDMLEINRRRLAASLSPCALLVKPETRRGAKIISSTDILQGRFPFDV